jgi:putative transposon-encoded protein
MEIDIKKVKGKIVLSEKEFNRMVERKVYPSNSSSGKINVPHALINKKVYVVWSDEGENK